MRFFFYGTLLDYDVTAMVLGRRLPPRAFAPAILRGHARRMARGVTYPVLARDPRAHVSGVVVGGLSVRDVERLAAYEGPRYRIASLGVWMAGRRTTVSVFEPIEDSFEPVEGTWSLTLWQRRQKRAFIHRVSRALSAHPLYSRQ